MRDYSQVFQALNPGYFLAGFGLVTSSLPSVDDVGGFRDGSDGGVVGSGDAAIISASLISIIEHIGLQ